MRACAAAAFAALGVLAALARGARALNVFPETVVTRIDKAESTDAEVKFMLYLEAEESDTYTWSVESVGNTGDLFDFDSFSEDSGTVSPGEQTIVTLQLSAAGVAAEDTHAYVELKLDTGEFDYYTYLYVDALVQSSPDATNCVTRAGWYAGHSEIYTAGERVPLQVDAYDSEGFNSTDSDVTFDCVLTDADGTELDDRHVLRYQGGNTFGVDVTLGTAGVFNVECFFFEDALGASTNITILPMYTPNAGFADLVRYSNEADENGEYNFTQCAWHTSCGGELTAGATGEVFRTNMLDDYENVIKPMEGYEDEYFETYVHLKAEHQDGNEEEFIEMKDTRKGYSEGAVTLTTSGTWSLTADLHGVVGITTEIVVVAAELTSVELYLQHIHAGDYANLTYGPGDLESCSWVGCVDVLAGDRIFGYVYGRDDYWNAVVPHATQVAYYRLVDWYKEDSPFEPFDGMSSAFSEDGARLDVEVVTPPENSGRWEAEPTFVFQYNVTKFPQSEESDDPMVHVQLYVGDRTDANISDAFLTDPNSIGGPTLIPGELDLSTSTVFVRRKGGDESIVKCNASDLGACAQVPTTSSFDVALVARDSYGNRFYSEYGRNDWREPRAAVLRPDYDNDARDDWRLSFDTDERLFHTQTIDEDYLVDYNGGVASFAYFTVYSDRLNSTGNYDLDVIIDLVAGDASAVNTKVYASTAAGTRGSECSSDAECGTAIEAGERAYFVAALHDSLGNPLGSNDAGVKLSAAAGLDTGRRTATVTDLGDGTFSFDLKLTTAGTWEVEVKVSFEEIAVNPILVTVNPGAPDADESAVFFVGCAADPVSTAPSDSCVLEPPSDDSGACRAGDTCGNVHAGDDAVWIVLPRDRYGNTITSSATVTASMSALSATEREAGDDATGDMALNQTTGEVDDEASYYLVRYQFSDAFAFNEAGEELTFIRTDFVVDGVALSTHVFLELEAGDTDVKFSPLRHVNSSGVYTECLSGAVCATATAGDRVTFAIETRDAFNNTRYDKSALDIAYEFDGSVAQSARYDGDGEYSFSLSDIKNNEAGEYWVSVTLQSALEETESPVHFLASPIYFNVVPGPATATQMLASRSGEDCERSQVCAPNAVAGTAFEVDLVARDKYGNDLTESPPGGGRARYETSERSGYFEDLGDGTFVAKVTLFKAEVQTMDVLFSGSDVQNSGFKIQVGPAPLDVSASQVWASLATGTPPSPIRCEVNSPCLTAKAGETVDFDVRLRDSYSNEAEASTTDRCLYRVGGEGRVASAAFNSSTGSFTFSASVEQVPGGDGIDDVVAVDVWHDRIVGSHGTVGGGSFGFQVVPAAASTTSSYVALAGEMSTCPRAMTGPCQSIAAGEGVDLEVHLLDEFDNPLVSPAQRAVSYTLDGRTSAALSTRPGIYSIKIAGAEMQVAGGKEIDVRLGEDALEKSPVRIDVVAATADAETSEVRRDGTPCELLEKCGDAVVAGEQVPFTVVARDQYGNARDSSSGPMELRVSGREPLEFEDLGDGTYLGMLNVSTASTLDIQATLGGVLVTRFNLVVVAAALNASMSSMQVKVGDGDASDCSSTQSAQALALESCAIASAGDELLVTVVPRDSFGNDASVSGINCGVAHGVEYTMEGSLGDEPAFESTQCELDESSALSYTINTKAAARLEFNTTLDGQLVAGEAMAVVVQPGALDAENVEVTRLGAREGDIVCSGESKAACGPEVPPGNPVDLHVRLRDEFGNQLSLAAVNEYSVRARGTNASETSFSAELTDVSQGKFELKVESDQVGAYEVQLEVNGEHATSFVLNWQNKPVATYGELTLSAPGDADPSSDEVKQALRESIAASLGVPVEWIVIDDVSLASEGDEATGEDLATSARRALLEAVPSAYTVQYTIASPDRSDTELVLETAAKIAELTPADFTAHLASDLGFEIETVGDLEQDEFEEPELSPAYSVLAATDGGAASRCNDTVACPATATSISAGEARNYTVTFYDEFENRMGYAPKGVGCVFQVRDKAENVLGQAIISSFEPLVRRTGTCLINARPVLSGEYYMRVFLGSIAEENAVAGMTDGVLFSVSAGDTTSLKETNFVFDFDSLPGAVIAGEPLNVTVRSRDEYGNLRPTNEDEYLVVATPVEGTEDTGASPPKQLSTTATHAGGGVHAATVTGTSQAAWYCVDVTLRGQSIEYAGTVYSPPSRAGDEALATERRACFHVQPAALSPSNTRVWHVVDPESAAPDKVLGLPGEVIADKDYLIEVDARDRFGNMRQTAQDLFKVRAKDVSGEPITGFVYERNTDNGITSHRISMEVESDQASLIEVNITAENMGADGSSEFIAGYPASLHVHCPEGFLPNSVVGNATGCVPCDADLVTCFGGSGAPFSVPQGFFLPPSASECDDGTCLMASIYACADEPACTTANESDRDFDAWLDIDVDYARLCATGYDPAVVLCDRCLDGWTQNDAGTECEKCPDSDAITYLRFFGLCGVILLFIFMLFALLYRSLQKSGMSVREAAGRGLAFLHENLEFLRDDMQDTMENVGAVWQIIIQNCQVLGQLWKQMAGRFPNFLEHIYGPLLVLDINPFSVMKLGCLAQGFSQGYWDSVMFKGSIPFVVFALACIVTYRKLNQIVDGAARGVPKDEIESIRTTMATVLVFAIFLLNLLHPSISSTMFETFNCKQYNLQTDGDEYWLQSDHGVRCYRDEWVPYATFSGVVIVVYVFGYPILLLAALRYLHHRSKVVPCDAGGVPIPGAQPFYTAELQKRPVGAAVASEGDGDGRKATEGDGADVPLAGGDGVSHAFSGAPTMEAHPLDTATTETTDGDAGDEGELEVLGKRAKATSDAPGVHNGESDEESVQSEDESSAGSSDEEDEKFEYWAPDPHSSLNRKVSSAETLMRHVRNALEDDEAKAKAQRRRKRATRRVLSQAVVEDGNGYIRVHCLTHSITGNFGSQIEVPVTQLNSDAVFSRFVHPFTVQYQEDYYYWQVYEICRRLVQTSFVVLVEIAAPEYVSMYALFVSIAGLCIQLYFLPYAEDDDDTLEVAFQLNLFVSLFGVVMQENLGYDWEGSWQEKLLMACSTALGCYVVYRLYKIMREWSGIVFSMSGKLCGMMCRTCWSCCLPQKNKLTDAAPSGEADGDAAEREGMPAGDATGEEGTMRPKGNGTSAPQ